MEFTDDLYEKLAFGKNAGYDLRNDTLENHLKTILDAVIDAEDEESERKIDAHDVIDLSRFLGILGSQKIQCTLRYNERPPVSYIIKTERHSSCRCWIHDRYFWEARQCDNKYRHRSE